MEDRVAVITGGNTGIGLSLAERLLKEDPNTHICLACRNKQKAKDATAYLLQVCPGAKISIILADVSDLGSVYKAAAEIKNRFRHVDYLFINAGIMPVAKVDWNEFFKCFFSSRCIHMFRTGDGLLNQIDNTTSDGLKQIFATNLFGHFVMIKELEGFLGGIDRTSQIIWTSSSNAKKDDFHLSDIQHSKGSEPYSSSKYASDLVSVAINERFNKQGVYSHTTCPGLVFTNLTFSIMPSWMWFLFLPLLLLLRLATSTITVSPFNGSEALFWLTRQKPERLDPHAKFYSQVSVLGKPFTLAKKMDIDPLTADETYQELSYLEEEIRPKIKRS